MIRIGVDVGGTHTDAVMMDGRTVLAAHKALTTHDVESGVLAAMQAVLEGSAISPEDVTAVMIGTTHFTNAVIERRHLEPTAIIRAALPTGDGIPPMTDWPDDIADALGRHTYMIEGGHMFNGLPIAPLNEEALRACLGDIAEKGIKALALSSAFSPANPSVEERMAAVAQEMIPDIAITQSHKIGRLGLLERENAALLNASLHRLAEKVVASFRMAIGHLGLTCPFYISQNDGTLMAAEFVAAYPALTFASGPTNSLRGAAALSGLQNAIVADIGGTTTDVGVLADGFPRESHSAIHVGGVRTNFRMPDIMAIGLGGGSIIHDDGGRIGPQSVGHELTTKGRIFGGDILTTSDIIVAAGAEQFGDPALVADVPTETIDCALNTMRMMIDDAIDQMRPSADPVPVILVGGGSILVSGDLETAAESIRPEHAGVANAIGASLAQVGAEVERIVSYSKINRLEAIEQLTDEAKTQLIAAGGDMTTMRVLDMEETMMAYMDDDAARLRIKLVADLAMSPVA